MVGGILFGAFSIIFCIVFCVFRAKKATVWSLGLKTLASICFILCGIYSIGLNGSNPISLLILAGLIMGLIGDIILDLKIMYPQQSDNYFIVGTTSFAVGHIFYFVAGLMYFNEVSTHNLLWYLLASVGVAALLTGIIILVSRKMGMNFGKVFGLVVTYSFILTFMVAFSAAIAIFNPMFWIFAAGMIVFFLSDLVLSMQYFGGRSEKIFIYINHILYYIAQVMLAFFILFAL